MNGKAWVFKCNRGQEFGMMTPYIIVLKLVQREIKEESVYMKNCIVI